MDGPVSAAIAPKAVGQAHIPHRPGRVVAAIGIAKLLLGVRWFAIEDVLAAPRVISVFLMRWLSCRSWVVKLEAWRLAPAKTVIRFAPQPPRRQPSEPVAVVLGQIAPASCCHAPAPQSHETPRNLHYLGTIGFQAQIDGEKNQALSIGCVHKNL